MQGALGFLIPIQLQMYQGIFQWKNFLNRLRIDRIMVMSRCLITTSDGVSEKGSVVGPVRSSLRLHSLLFLIYCILWFIPVARRGLEISVIGRCHKG